ncbi:unnamed protein product, partial [Meganyctiphanes norvegica]
MAKIKAISQLYTMADSKLVLPAADRNKEPILEVLEKVIPAKFGKDSQLSALEIASGSGQHVIHFAQAFKNIVWQPTDYDAKYVNSIKVYITENNAQNIKEPLTVDVSKALSEWPGDLQHGSLDLIVNANMVHISPWCCTEGLFSAAGKLLKTGGTLFTYGPYAIHGQITPESNVRFDAGLKAQDSSWGLRDVDDLEKEGKKNGILLDAMFNMPANNKTLVWTKNK